VSWGTEKENHGLGPGAFSDRMGQPLVLGVMCEDLGGGESFRNDHGLCRQGTSVFNEYGEDLGEM